MLLVGRSDTGAIISGHMMCVTAAERGSIACGVAASDVRAAG